MQSVFSSLTSNFSEIAIYAAIGIITLIGFVKCVYPVFRNASLLNRAVSRLEKSTADGTGKPVWQEPRFLGRSLQGEWQQFLLNAGQLGIRGISCDTSEYINEDTVIEKPGHSSLSDLIPGLLTSLGILGTFMGLMQGLTSVDFSNAEGTISSIPELLSGMRFAFATSVAGISCSLVFNVINRMCVGKATRALDNFEEAFYDLAMPRPLETDTQMILQKQDQNAVFLQMADSIASKMSSSVESALGRAMVPLTQSMDSFMKGATRDQEEGLRRIVGQFVQQMNVSLNGQFTALGNVMQAASETQAQTQQALQNLLVCVRSMTENAQSMSNSGSDIAHNMQLLSMELSNAVAQQEQLAQDAARIQNVLDQRAEAFDASLAELQVAVDMYSAGISAGEDSKAAKIKHSERVGHGA